MDRNKIKDWGENIKTQTISRQEFAGIWEDKGDVSMSINIQAGEWF